MEKRLELERKLLNWLKQRSLTQIFDWFNCLEETTVKPPSQRETVDHGVKRTGPVVLGAAGRYQIVDNVRYLLMTTVKMGLGAA